MVSTGHGTSSMPAGEYQILPKSVSKSSTIAMNITAKTTEVDSNNIYSRNYKVLKNKVGTV